MPLAQLQLFAQQFQQLTDILLAESDGLSVVNDQTGYAHDIVFVTDVREMIQQQCAGLR